MTKLITVFIVLVVLWAGTAYAASALAYYGASGIAWLIFDLYRARLARDHAQPTL